MLKLENFRLRQNGSWHLIFWNWNFLQLLAMLFLYSNLVLTNIFFSSHPHPYPYLFFPPLPSMLSFPRLFIFPLTSFPLLYLPFLNCIFLPFTASFFPLLYLPFLYCASFLHLSRYLPKTVSRKTEYKIIFPSEVTIYNNKLIQS